MTNSSIFFLHRAQGKRSMCLKVRLFPTGLNLTNTWMIVRRHVGEIYEDTFWNDLEQTGDRPV